MSERVTNTYELQVCIDGEWKTIEVYFGVSEELPQNRRASLTEWFSHLAFRVVKIMEIRKQI